MNTHHGIRLSNLDFGDSLKIFVCDICGYSVSFHADENGNLLPESLQRGNPGNFNASHGFSTGMGGDLTLSVSIEE